MRFIGGPFGERPWPTRALTFFEDARSKQMRRFFREGSGLLEFYKSSDKFVLRCVGPWSSQEDIDAVHHYACQFAQEAVAETGIWMPYWFRDARLIGSNRVAYLIKGAESYQGAVMMDTSGYHTLAWAWLTPKLRRRGVFSYVRELLEHYHPGFTILAPLSRAMETFLSHKDPRGMHPVVETTGTAKQWGKTHSVLRMAEDSRQGLDTFGHSTTVSDYCILLHDRSSASMRRTCKAAKVSVDEVMSRVIRLTRAQQKERPAVVVEAAIQTRPGVKLWILEGLDFWTPKIGDIEAVGDVMDELQRVAKQYQVAIVSTLGSPKQKENDRYASGRDQFMGSVAFGRKSETCISIENTSDASIRKMMVMPRNTAKEEFFFTWTPSGLALTTEPTTPDKKADENSALRRMEANVLAATRIGEELKYSQRFGPPATFFRWRKVAQAEGKVTLSGKKCIARIPGEWSAGRCNRCGNVGGLDNATVCIYPSIKSRYI